VQILGISLDPVSANRAFAEKEGFPFPLLSDPDRSVALAYGAVAHRDALFAARFSFLIGTDGRIERSIVTGSASDQADELLALFGGGA
jgi:peroxiredoxin Q/BCP